jgi:hypothetical protein
MNFRTVTTIVYVVIKKGCCGPRCAITDSEISLWAGQHLKRLSAHGVERQKFHAAKDMQLFEELLWIPAKENIGPVCSLSASVQTFSGAFSQITSSV